MQAPPPGKVLQSGEKVSAYIAFEGCKPGIVMGHTFYDGAMYYVVILEDGSEKDVRYNYVERRHEA